ncbi:MAG: L,D-transpeptidase family protein [bacterium]
MKIISFIIIPLALLAIIFMVGLGFMLPKQRKAEMEQFITCEEAFKEGKYQSAIPLLENFIKDHNRSKKLSDAYYYLAKSNEELANYDKAMETWEKIIKDYPKGNYISEAHYYLGLNYERNGQNDMAMQNYKIVVDKYADTPIVAGALLGIGKINELAGNETEAIAVYQEVIDKYPETKFASDAEQRHGSINLKKFLKENAKVYQIQKGESLATIARRFYITPALIMKLNNLKNNAVNAGQKIKIIDGTNFNILINLSSCKLYLRDGDKLIKVYPVCVGAKDTPTPIGNYKIIDKAIDPVWFSDASTGGKGIIPGGDPRNELGTRWIGFKKAFGIHGTIFPDSIGKPESHGCVRMHNKDVEELYDLVSEGIPVKIVNSL